MRIGSRLLKPSTAARHHISSAIASKAKLSLLRKRRPWLGISVPHTLACVKKLYKDGHLDKAIQAAEDMHREGFAASTDILYYLLQACTDNRDLTSGRRVHQLVTNCGFVKNAFLGSHLIRMFALCGSFKEATNVFDKIPKP
eukprot:c30304_g1_i1 orf=242-667(+)